MVQLFETDKYHSQFLIAGVPRQSNFGLKNHSHFALFDRVDSEVLVEVRESLV